MKKAISFLMVVAVMASTLWFNVGTASAGSSNVSFYANGVTQADAKNALMLVNSDYVEVYCALKEDNLVVCNIQGKYAGEDVQIYMGDQVFYVSVPELKPEQSSKSSTAETPACEEERMTSLDDNCEEEPVCEELVDCEEEPVCEELVDCEEPVCEELGNCEEPTCEELGNCEEPTCEELGNCEEPTCEELGNCEEPTCEELGNCEEPVCEEGQILVDGNCEEETLPEGPTGPCFLRWTGSQWVHWWDGTPEYPGACP